MKTEVQETFLVFKKIQGNSGRNLLINVGLFVLFLLKGII